jgi:hypothetical protein
MSLSMMLLWATRKTEIRNDQFNPRFRVMEQFNRVSRHMLSGRGNITIGPAAFTGVPQTFLCRGIFRPESLSSVRPAAEASFRHGKSVPESYRIDEFKNARRRRLSRSPEPAGSPPRNRFLTVVT